MTPASPLPPPTALSRWLQPVARPVALAVLVAFLSHAGLMAQDAGQSGPVAGDTAVNLGTRPKNARTVIESDGGATFDNTRNSAQFIGRVVVKDPQFDLTCDSLDVILRPDRKGLLKAVASGNVVITQERRNERGDLVKSVGKCGRATYDVPTGDVTLQDWPQIQQGINNQIATEARTVMILNAKGRSRTIGSSRTMIVDQGEKALTP
jgi:lipopolysaccharide export system protein LptA